MNEHATQQRLKNKREESANMKRITLNKRYNRLEIW